MKISKEEIKNKINEKISDDDLKIELLEDIEDSMQEESQEETISKEEYDKVLAERDEIKQKYKERFFSGANEPVKEIDEEKEEDEKEIVDIKEI